MYRFIVVACVVLIIQGCGALTPPKAKPVIEDRISQHRTPTVGVLATTAERRVVIVKMPGQLFCSEAPADVGENISQALSVALKTASKDEIGAAQQLATSVQQLFYRSQGMQLFRDGSFMLCNARMNGFIDAQAFVERHQALLEATQKLILAEIPHMRDVKPAAAVLPSLSKNEGTSR